MKIQENIPLAPMTTFQVGGPARYFVDAQTESEIKDAVGFAAEHRLPLFVLGGGSNLVVSDEGWPGLVVKIGLQGVAGESDGATRLYIAGAGEHWDALVAHTVSENCAGLECLSGIPGTVGGTPVQNVGAYGQEVAQTITRVRVLEITSGRVREMDNISCKFRYRSSIFNGDCRGQYIVLQVEYRLTPGGSPTVAYADLKNHFSSRTCANPPTLSDVREAVRDIRRSKAMLLVTGDEDCRSAGSFFKNPVLSSTEADRVQQLATSIVPGRTLPRYPGPEGQVKLAAAWLVEHAGFHKGYNRGRVGISRKHSLAIVNRGGATASDIVSLKNEVQTKVRGIWGVDLQPEPVFVGF